MKTPSHIPCWLIKPLTLLFEIRYYMMLSILSRIVPREVYMASNLNCINSYLFIAYNKTLNLRFLDFLFCTAYTE